jgi:hypothetical protein
VLLVLAGCDGGNDRADQSEAETASQANAKEVAAGFLEAFAAFDAGGAIGFLADDAIILELVGSEGTQGVEGSLDELRMLISLLEAQRFQQLLDACEETGSSPSGDTVSCGFDYHLFGSDDVGLGPYTGAPSASPFETGRSSERPWRLEPTSSHLRCGNPSLPGYPTPTRGMPR